VRGRLFPVGGEWYEWRQEPALAATVHVRVESSPGGRLVLTGLRIDGPPSAELLRALPVGRIEAAANAQLAAVDDVIVPAPTPARRRRRPTGPPNGASGGWETTDVERALRRTLGSAGPAGVPPPRGRPDLFYRQIAEVYLDFAQVSHRPAADLADTHRVPVTTAHRWIKEARRRGFLPPGRPGKSG
jgi:hypothetical protein